MANLQTFNNPVIGPTFGGGFDLFVDEILLTGYSLQHTYGDPGSCSSFGGANIFGIADAACNTPHQTTQFRIGELEVYGVAPQTENEAPPEVPEPASLILLGTGLVCLVRCRQRKCRIA